METLEKLLDEIQERQKKRSTDLDEAIVAGRKRIARYDTFLNTMHFCFGLLYLSICATGVVFGVSLLVSREHAELFGPGAGFCAIFVITIAGIALWGFALACTTKTSRWWKYQWW